MLKRKTRHLGNNSSVSRLKSPTLLGEFGWRPLLSKFAEGVGLISATFLSRLARNATTRNGNRYGCCFQFPFLFIATMSLVPAAAAAGPYLFSPRSCGPLKWPSYVSSSSNNSAAVSFEFGSFPSTIRRINLVRG
jgi:hypothetical protein